MSAFRRSLSVFSPARGSSFTSSASSTSPPSGSRTASSSSTTTDPINILTKHLDSSLLPSFLITKQGQKTLYSHLIQLPNNGIGTKVRQTRWVARGIDQPFGRDFKGPIKNPLERKQDNHLCYWEITKARIRKSGEKGVPHGKVWGRLVWRGG